MKGILLGLLFFANTVSAQISLEKLKLAATKGQKVIDINLLSEDDVIDGLQEALLISAKKSILQAGTKGGFQHNSLIKIFCPDEAKEMKSALINLGMHSEVEKFEAVLNEAAEEATSVAVDIFIEAINNMTINDAKSILKGQDNAATIYLRRQTSETLYSQFKPVVTQSVKKVSLAKYWDTLTKTYNSLPFTNPVNTDLEDHVTSKTIQGLFILIEKEEKNIRNNPKARTSAILQKVFK